MDPLSALMTGLKTKWVGTPALASIPIFRHVAPGTQEALSPTTIRPYVIIETRLDSTKISETVQREYWRHSINFRVHDTTPEQAAITTAKIYDTFNPRSLSLTLPTNHVLTMAKATTVNSKDEYESQGDNEVQTLGFEFTTSVLL